MSPANAASACRLVSTLRMPLMTVVWSRPPKTAPIQSRLRPVNRRARYIARLRPCTMLRVRFGPTRSPAVRPCREAVARTMRPTDQRSEVAVSLRTAGDGHGTWSTRPAASRDASDTSRPVQPGGLVSDTQTVTPAAARASRRPVTACWVSDPPTRSMPRTITRCIPDTSRMRCVADASSPSRRAVPSSRPSSSITRRG